MNVITYSLRDGQRRSETYYRDIAAFSDEVLAEAEGRAGALVAAFQTYLRQTEWEAPRSRPEYAFELLSLGVLWRVYAGDALSLTRMPQRMLTSLVRWRRKENYLKPAVDFLRGVLGSLFLLPDKNPSAAPSVPDLDQLERLLDWLAATGDFEQELKRLRIWRDFLASQPPQDLAESLAAITSLAAWFEVRSQAVLGHYTPHVERFLAETHPSYRWREDAIFCGRRRVEYHLNMIGTEIMNRAFREAFLDTERKAVLVPPCMKGQPDDKCQARPTPFGARCAGCTPGCRVHQLTRLGEKHGFEVLLMPDELSVFSTGAVKPVEGDAVGIIGISCVLTNASGGWETRDLGIPTQGVLLDYCGCRYHWHKEGIPTDINVIQLLRVLDIRKSKSQKHTTDREAKHANNGVKEIG
jgi:hypothetical protein